MEKHEIKALLKHGSPTRRQRELLEALAEHGSVRGAARALDTAPKNVRWARDAVKRKATAKGWAPEYGMVHPAPDGFLVKGDTTLYHAEKGQVLQWVKRDRDREKQFEIMKTMAMAVADEITPVEPVAPPAWELQEDLANVHFVTDYHLAMKAWPEETRNAAWDTGIARDLLVNWFRYSIEHAPEAEVGVLAQMGDFLHWDGMMGPVTPASGHILDADSRFQLMIRVAIRALREVVAMMLAKYQRVHIILLEGNHDPAGSAWLRELHEALYENEPRISVDISPDPYACFEHGLTSLFFHHGHKVKIESVDRVMAAKFREVFGRTEFSYAHLGHLHHKRVLESPLMIAEQHPTLAAPDAYATRGGWLSKRSANVITYSKRFGEVARLPISPEMVL